MAKFKVGDKVRVDIRLADAHKDGRYGIDSECVWDYNAVRTIEEICGVSDGITGYTLSIGRGFFWPEYALVSAEPRREFIVIHRSGNVMTAEHRVNREVIKSAKATCAHSDTFDFDTGAKLAFDRLMGREEPKHHSAPEPPKFYTGKVFAEKSIREGYESRNGKVFEFVNGECINATPEDSLEFEVLSFDYLCKEANFTKWHEVKSDV